MTAIAHRPAHPRSWPALRRIRTPGLLLSLATFGGMALGEACYQGMQGGPSVAEQWAAVLADFGSPWALTAFVVGVGAVILAERGPIRSTTAGAIGGSWALAVATIVYYRLGPDRLADRIQTYIGFWLIVGLGVGCAAGAAGAWWWQRRDREAGLWALVGVASLVSGEALFTWATGYYTSTAPLTGLFALLVAAGPTAAALLAPHGFRLRAAVLVLVVALPTTMVLDQMSQVYRSII